MSTENQAHAADPHGDNKEHPHYLAHHFKSMDQQTASGTSEESHLLH